MVSTRTATGSLGILANHAPLMAMLEPTELRLYKSESDVVTLRAGRGLPAGGRQPRARAGRGGDRAGRARPRATSSRRLREAEQAMRGRRGGLRGDRRARARRASATRRSSRSAASPQTASGSPKCAEHAGVAEPGDRRDRVPVERQHHQPVGARDRRLRVGQVAAERRLAVGARGHDPQRRAAAARAVAQERGDRLVALVLERLGRHREPGVVGEQRDDAVDVAALHGVGEAPDQLALARGVRQRRALAVGGRQPRCRASPGRAAARPSPRPRWCRASRRPRRRGSRARRAARAPRAGAAAGAAARR